MVFTSAKLETIKLYIIDNVVSSVLTGMRVLLLQRVWSTLTKLASLDLLNLLWTTHTVQTCYDGVSGTSKPFRRLPVGEETKKIEADGLFSERE